MQFSAQLYIKRYSSAFFSAASNPTAISEEIAFSSFFLLHYVSSRAHGLTFILYTFIYNKAKCELLKQGEM